MIQKGVVTTEMWSATIPVAKDCKGPSKCNSGGPLLGVQKAKALDPGNTVPD